jgi:1,3-beta-glucan synthase
LTITNSPQTRLIDLPPSQRFTKFDRIEWNRAFFKTYYEKRSFGHLLVNFNRIWVIHISLFFFYTAFWSPTIYRFGTRDSLAMRISATALGGAVSTIIMILATLAEFSYIPTTWNNTSHLTRRLLFLFVTLGLTCGPTFYVAIVESNNTGGSLAYVLSIVQLCISIVATLLFAIIPSGRMFGDRVAGKSRKYLASQTFTASYPVLPTKNRVGSVALWVLVFLCKFVESYFYLTLSFKDPIRVMVGMKVQNCRDRYFGAALCFNQAAFTLTIMYIMDLILFFLDTFLWYIIWNTVFSIARSFMLGLSIWTPWKDIYTRLPKRIYSKLLATGDMEVKYKPKVRRQPPLGIRTCQLTLFLRSWSRRSGTPSSSQCTGSIFCRLTMSRSCCTTRSTPVREGVVAYALPPSSSPKVTRVSKENTSLLAAKRSVVSLSSPSLSPR